MSISGNPLVIDLGSSEIRAGYSGENEPQLIFPNYIGEPKYNKILKTFNRENEEIKDIYVGEECSKYMGIVKLRYPISRGSFSSESDIPIVFSHIFSRLHLSPEEIQNHPILIAEPLLNIKTNRESISEILFEKFNTPGVFFASQPILSLFSESNTTGTVLESGDGVTQVCSVYEGYSLPSSFIRYDYGGRDITEYLQKLLKKQGIHLNSDTEYLFVKGIKEKYCYSSTGLSDYSLNKKSEVSKSKVSLPDLKEIILDSERSTSTQVLFSPSLVGKNYLGVHQMLATSIGKVDVDYRAKLFFSIIITGGNALMKTFTENISNELKNLVPRSIRVKVHKTARPVLCCWTGGTLVTSLGVFKEKWVTKKDWDEKGKDIIHNNSI